MLILADESFGGIMKLWVHALGAILLASAAAPASAGVFSDDLARCLVSKTTAEDKTELARWVFAAVAQGDAVKDMIRVTPEQMQKHNRVFAQLMERLLTVDCRSAAVSAIRNEGDDAIESSFGVLGESAFNVLMSDPKVDEAMSGLAEVIDSAKFEELEKEAASLE